MLTEDHAMAIIDYLETMEHVTDHASNMRRMKGLGYSEEELDVACRALATVAKRTYSLL